jgi:hypothetical protein
MILSGVSRNHAKIARERVGDTSAGVWYDFRLAHRAVELISGYDRVTRLRDLNCSHVPIGVEQGAISTHFQPVDAVKVHQHAWAAVLPITGVVEDVYPPASAADGRNDGDGHVLTNEGVSLHCDVLDRARRAPTRQEQQSPWPIRVIADNHAVRSSGRCVGLEVSAGTAHLCNVVALDEYIRSTGDCDALASVPLEVIVADPDIRGPGWAHLPQVQEVAVHVGDGDPAHLATLHPGELDPVLCLQGNDEGGIPGAGVRISPSNRHVPDRDPCAAVEHPVAASAWPLVADEGWGGHAAPIRRGNKCGAVSIKRQIAPILQKEGSLDPVSGAGTETDDRAIRYRGKEAGERCCNVGGTAWIDVSRNFVSRWRWARLGALSAAALKRRDADEQHCHTDVGD